MTEIEKFARLVNDMIEAQQKYFRHDRSSAQLELCKRLEKDVKRAIERVLHPQMGLFEDDGT